MVGISKDFKRRIIKGYKTDPAWTKILVVLYGKSSEDAARLSFVLGEEVDDSGLDNTTILNNIPNSQEALDDSGLDNANVPNSPSQEASMTPTHAPTESRAIAVRIPRTKAPRDDRPHTRLPEASEAFRHRPHGPTEARAVAVRVPPKKPSASRPPGPTETRAVAVRVPL